MPTETVRLTLSEVHELSAKALIASGTAQQNAESVARSIAAAEADGIHSHGLMRLPAYCDHVQNGKVDGKVMPTLTQPAPSVFKVDAACGFAHPAIELGFNSLLPVAQRAGIASLAVFNSYNCGVLGYHVERLAAEGALALAFVNAPAAIAPWGGRKPVFGTNPIAFAAPRKARAPLVIDQSSSVVARGEVILKAKQGKRVPDTWGFGSDGRPTTDPEAILDGGSMAPVGGYKGVALALMVEVLAAALTGASFSFEASSLIDNDGGPPRIGQFFVALNPDLFVGQGFLGRLEDLCAAVLAQPGARLPGERRLAARETADREGVRINKQLFDDLMKRVRDLSI